MQFPGLDAIGIEQPGCVGRIANPAHDFNIRSMRITILDERGDVIESGQASPFLEDPNGWEYLPQAYVPPGTEVTVHITAIDCMGGIGRGWERKIFP